jgi:hypothetical protein
MTDDREALVREIQRLLKANRRWRAVAIAALALVFVFLITFTMGFWWLLAEVVPHDASLRSLRPRLVSLRNMQLISAIRVFPLQLGRCG